MNHDRLRQILTDLKGVTVAVYGDFCLDAYWIMDPQGSEVSAETGLPAQAVAHHYYSLGGASNVVANLAALQPAAIHVVGVIGDDIFGREIARQFHQLGVNTDHLIVQPQDFDTPTFGKRIRQADELPRIDFGFRNRRSPQTDHALLAGLDHVLHHADALIFNQQVPGSIPRLDFIHHADALFARDPDKIVLLDSRHYGRHFRHVCRKTNAVEAARLNDHNLDPDDIVPLHDLQRYAQHLFHQSQLPVFITRGDRGMLVCDAQGLHIIPAIQLLKKLDPVGAGDTTVSALALCLGARIAPAEAAQLANVAAAVTVQKLFVTGAAAPDEILQLAAHADYIYQPELADDPRPARFLDHSEIERCYPLELLPQGCLRHAVFDHDGTLSTLRQGWEQVMQPVMLHAILGHRYDSADEALYHKVLLRVRDYIDQSTGIQTILQMEALVDMVREFSLVPPEEILDKAGYKKIYNHALMQLVDQRLARLRTGQLDVPDFTLKGAVQFLHILAGRGVTLYLASGTDAHDVRNEATALGYAHLFGDRIYGALDDVKQYSKKMVIDRIMAQHHLAGPELAVFGDGPVELREARKHQGLAVGIASHELRRHGLNQEKRARLIKAGAHLIAPDFSQPQPLLNLLFS